MSDTRYSGSSNPSGQGVSNTAQAGGSTTEKSAMAQATALAGDLKKQASDVAQHATRQVKEQASQLTESAKGLASEAGEKLRSAAEDQKNAGADYVSGLAGAVRRAASEFDDQIPQAGQYIRRAADQIENASDALRRRDLNELLGNVQDFARRQPTAFLGATVLAGFAMVRFLKSSTAPQSSAGSSSWQPEQESFSQSRGCFRPAGVFVFRRWRHVLRA